MDVCFILENYRGEVLIDEQHFFELIVSPYNISRAIRKVMSNGESESAAPQFCVKVEFSESTGFVLAFHLAEESLPISFSVSFSM